MSKIKVFILFPENLLIQVKLFFFFFYMENKSKHSNMGKKRKLLSPIASHSVPLGL